MDAPPLPDGTDRAYSLLKAAISAVPVVGGPAAELLSLVLQPPLEQRRAQWLDDLAHRLSDLQTEGISLDRLKSDERFITAVLRATQAALRTHQTAKLEALRNAVVNIGRLARPDDVLQELFLQYIDELSAAHLQLLKAADIFPYAEDRHTSIDSIARSQMPEIVDDWRLLRVLWNDLQARGLVDEHLHPVKGGRDQRRPGVTVMGKAMLALVSSSSEA